MKCQAVIQFLEPEARLTICSHLVACIPYETIYPNPNQSWPFRHISLMNTTQTKQAPALVSTLTIRQLFSANIPEKAGGNIINANKPNN
jgi:hypothetical protein